LIAGKIILNTRARDFNDEFEKILGDKNAVVIHFPVIEINGIGNNKKLTEIIEQINSYDGIFFTSANGVRFFFDELNRSGKKFSGLIYSVGEKTSEKIKEYGYRPYFSPVCYSSGKLVEDIDKESLRGKRFLFPRGNLASDTLISGLADYTSIEEVIVYNNTYPDYNEEEIEKIREKLNSKEIDCTVFFSPSAVENFIRLTEFSNSSETDIAVIGQTTFRKAVEKGLEPLIIAQKPSSDYLAYAIIEYYEKN
jgi:uroporphyrinogen-III synthase